MPVSIDHIVYGTPDLERSVEDLAKALGVKASPGGRHPQWGTRNALLSLGNLTYLEILGPDPDQPPPGQSRPFGLDEIETPQMIAWAAAGGNLEAIVSLAGKLGIKLGRILPGTRSLPDGSLLAWRLIDPGVRIENGLIPFFIDWGGSPHPSLSAPKGCTLADLRCEHPDPDRLAGWLSALGLEIAVSESESRNLVATVQTPLGLVEL